MKKLLAAILGLVKYIQNLRNLNKLNSIQTNAKKYSKFISQSTNNINFVIIYHSYGLLYER